MLRVLERIQNNLVTGTPHSFHAEMFPGPTVCQAAALVTGDKKMTPLSEDGTDWERVSKRTAWEALGTRGPRSLRPGSSRAGRGRSRAGRVVQEEAA